MVYFIDIVVIWLRIGVGLGWSSGLFNKVHHFCRVLCYNGINKLSYNNYE